MEIMPLTLNFKKMKELREAKGWSQREAGERARLGVNPAQRWQSLESGKRLNVELETVNRIADALGVDGRELLEG